MSTPNISKHFSVLDSFRGLCACIVAISHFNANSIFHGSSLFDRGSIYVDFFFVLSGFVIFANYKERLRNGYGIGKFVFLRFGRLYPLHLAIFLAFIFVDALQLCIHVDNAALYKPFSGPGEDIGAMIANVLLIHSMGVLDTLAFNGPSWSISVEFYTYILFALILAYTGKFYRHIIVLFAVASMTIVFINHEDLYAKLDYGFFRCVYGFACGAIVWEIYNKFNNRFEKISSNKLKINLLEIGFFTLSVVYIWLFSFETMSFLAPIIFGLLVFLFAFEGGCISQILKNKVFLLLGTLSYSIYMTHLFISGKLFALPIRIMEGRMGWNITKNIDGLNVYGQNLTTGTILELFYLLVVVICSYISYKTIEEPFRKLSKKIVANTLSVHNKNDK